MNFTREENVLIFCLGCLKELYDKKVIVWHGMKLKRRGYRQFRLLKKDGFEPTETEIDMALEVIMNDQT